MYQSYNADYSQTWVSHLINVYYLFIESNLMFDFVKHIDMSKKVV